MQTTTLCLLSLLFLPQITVAQSTAITSIYTSLAQKDCRLLAQGRGEESWIERECPGSAGYKLVLTDDDLRQSITVVTPQGKKYPLNYDETITGKFSTLGKKAEWRVVQNGGKIFPQALIVRVSTRKPETEEAVDYLAVAKITDTEICVTDRIEPGPRSNEQAREAAGRSMRRSCVKTVARQ